MIAYVGVSPAVALFDLVQCQQRLARRGADAAPGSLLLRVIALRPGALAVPAGPDQSVSPLAHGATVGDETGRVQRQIGAGDCREPEAKS